MPQAASNYEPPHRKTTAQRKREHDLQRPSAAKRGYGKRWQKYRLAFLSRPENVLCAVDGCNAPAEVVDHIVPHKGDAGLFWDPANHQALCKRCHDSKTAREDGGFGH